MFSALKASLEEAIAECVRLEALDLPALAHQQVQTIKGRVVGTHARVEMAEQILRANPTQPAPTASPSPA